MMLDNPKSYRWSAFLVAILVLSLFAMGCSHTSDNVPTSPAETVDYIIHQGWDHYSAGEYDAAIVSFSDAANASASDLEAYLGLGYSFAASGELVRAQQNFENVIALSTVLENDPVINLDPNYADTLRAEAYAGKAAAYLANQDYSDAVSNAVECIAIWDGFTTAVHRWIPDFNMKSVKLIEAEAHYGAGEFNEAMYIVDDLMDGSYIANSDHIFEANETLTVTLLEDTPLTGVALLRLNDHTNLIDPESVMSAINQPCQVQSFDAAGDQVWFKVNPIPEQNDTFAIHYLYADDFGRFLIELRDNLNELEG